MSKYSRRRVLQGAAASSVLLAAPSASARVAPRQRKFIFLFAGGGWDTTQAFEAQFGASGVDMPPMTRLGQANGLRFTAGDDRPSVERFFQRWGNRAAIVNGIDVHSIGHDAGRNFMLTGSSASALSDWPTLLAAHSAEDQPLPHVVFSGPVVAGPRGATVVRGGGGTLVDLVDGGILGAMDAPAPAVSRPADSLVDAWVYERTADWANGRGGLGRRRLEALLASQGRAIELEARRFEAGLGRIGRGLLSQGRRAAELMRLGLSRCAMIGIPGGYDTHNNNLPQGDNFEDFFSALDSLMDHLAIMPGHAGPRLLDEVVIVAMSELGRTPRLNGGGGKDHWPWTSSLVVGPGVAGGRMIGRTDEGLRPVSIDFATGAESASGDRLGCEHLGAALLTLGGVDPSQLRAGVQVLDALLA